MVTRQSGARWRSGLVQSNEDFETSLRGYWSAQLLMWQRTRQPINWGRQSVERPRVLGSGLFMEDEHVIRGPQTAGEGRRVTVLVSYISLANYMSRRAAV